MSFSTVVIGVDYSATLSHGGAWVRRTIAPDARFILVNTFEPSEIPSFLQPLVGDAGAHAVEELGDAISRLEAWRDSNGLPDAQLIVREGRPDAVLKAVARECGADLVVVGAHGSRLRPWRRVGTTTERILRGTDASVLVLHGEPGAPPATILAAVDDASVTPSLLAIAGGLADRLEARLHAIHVLSNASYSHVLSMEAAESRTREEAETKLQADMADEALRWLRQLWQHTQRHGRLEADIRHGAAADEILREADELPAGLIVLGRTGMGRALPPLLGSVVGSVVHGANCPVLVVSDAR